MRREWDAKIADAMLFFGGRIPAPMTTFGRHAMINSSGGGVRYVFGNTATSRGSWTRWDYPQRYPVSARGVAVGR
jgi:hypothetical protein